nr:hypothetical protein CFOL_v3_32523 [Ipomoea batatas]
MLHMERVSRDGSLPNGGNDEQFMHIRISRIRRLSRDCVIQEGKWLPPYPINCKVCSSEGGFRASIPTLTPGQSSIFKDSSLLKSFGKITPLTSATPRNSLPTYLSSFMRHMERVSREGSLPNGGKDEQFTHLAILRIRRLSRDCVIQEGKWLPPYPLNSKVCSSEGGFKASIISIPTSTPSLKCKHNSLICFLFLNSAFSASSTSAVLFRSHKKDMDSFPLSWFSFSISSQSSFLLPENAILLSNNQASESDIRSNWCTYTLPIILATLSLLEVTKILLPWSPSLREFFNGAHSESCSVHTSSITSRNLFPDKVLLIFSSNSWSWDRSVDFLVIDSTMAFAILIWQERAATCLWALDLLSQTSGSPLVQNIVHLVGEVFDIFDPELDALFLILKASLLCIIQYLPDILEL